MRSRNEGHIEELKTDKFHQVVAPTVSDRSSSPFIFCGQCTMIWRQGPPGGRITRTDVWNIDIAEQLLAVLSLDAA